MNILKTMTVYKNPFMTFSLYEIYKTGALYLSGFNIERKTNSVIMYLYSAGMQIHYKEKGKWTKN